MTMRSSIRVEAAPQPVGPYSQAQVVDLPGGGRLVHTAGQVGLDPSRGEMVAGGIQAQTQRVLENLTAILAGAGCTLADIVKTTVFLTDMQDFRAMNEVYARHFSASFPARSTVAVVGLPLGALVEIEVVAFKNA